jgi:hypothetical protein
MIALPWQLENKERKQALQLIAYVPIHDTMCHCNNNISFSSTTIPTFGPKCWKALNLENQMTKIILQLKN